MRLDTLVISHIEIDGVEEQLGLGPYCRQHDGTACFPITSCVCKQSGVDTTPQTTIKYQANVHTTCGHNQMTNYSIHRLSDFNCGIYAVGKRQGYSMNLY